MCSQVFSYDDIDLEKPEYLSPPLTLYVFNQLELHGNVLSSNVTMPLHIRYHRPFRGPSHVPVEVVLPEVYVACHPGIRGVPQASGFLIYRGAFNVNINASSFGNSCLSNSRST